MPKITTLDEFEAAYKARLGEPMPPRRPWRAVTEEWLARYADGAGDYNPLYRDRAYAEAGPYHDLVAPPAFIFSIDFGANASIWGHIPEADVSMQDLTILYIGATAEWFRPIWLGDRVRSIETPTDIRKTTTRQLGEALICTGTTEYWNSRRELLARLTNHMLRFPNPGAGVESSSPTEASGPRVAPDPLVWQRTRRGSEARYADTVSADDPIPDLPKGTFTTTELYLFTHGALSTRRARHVDEGTIDMGAGGRADPEYARKARAQSASFDFGPQRICWLTQAVTDWMGDHGKLLRIETRLHRPNLIGDTNTVRGTVVRTYEHSTEACADVEVENVNQSGAITASGRATVALPTRGSVPVHELLFAPTADGTAGIYN
ncbi:FAS1-like dehydratase domain-containing protein [Mycobacterium sp.]|uniref:FAS1-like dehydratase domain-containing protein n=1 Tax=Mycobacterium sp. TaxID=1785 RepID=UPI002D1FBCB0|nr:MaoC family dehydratase N-terminal domain-containing protein [Mycobacterium sp.]